MKKLFCTLLMLVSMNGFATDCKVNDSDIAGTYSGGCKNGLAHGKGVAQGKDRYEGMFANGNAHGKGVYNWAGGAQYDGEWQDGHLTGKGTYAFANGDRYEGQFVDGRKEGYGVMYWASGTRKEGEWLNNELVNQIHDKRACDRLYAGKQVNAPIHGLATLFGQTTESSIVLGFSRETGLVTIRSINNSQMVGEVYCDELR